MQKRLSPLTFDSHSFVPFKNHKLNSKERYSFGPNYSHVYWECVIPYIPTYLQIGI